jgi:glycosyltransferase involved in cell wall biosynthesis
VSGSPPSAGPPGARNPGAGASGHDRPGARAPRVGVVAEQLFGAVPGGIGRYVRALARHLEAEGEARGGAVRWLVARHPAERIAAAGLPPERTRALAWPGRLATRAWVELRRPRLPARLAGELDLLHATSAAIPPARGLPLVATVHDIAFRHFPEAYPASGRRFHERATRIAVAEAARVLVPSAATARDLADLYGLEPERVTVTPLGVDPPPAPDPEPVRRLLERLGVRGPFLLAVGTLEPRKNLGRLVAAFAEAAAELPEHHLVVVGPSGWGKALAAGAVPPRIDGVPPRVTGTTPPRVVLTGRVEDAVLQGLYSLADGLAYPSLYEGFGLPVLEAMARGLPVLTSDRSSLPEVAGGAALLVDPADVPAIAKGLVELVSDRALRQRLAADGPRRAAAFTWRATAAATWAAYEEVLG